MVVLVVLMMWWVRLILPRAGVQRPRSRLTRCGPTSDPLLKFSRPTRVVLRRNLVLPPVLEQMALNVRTFVECVVRKTE